MTSEEAMDRVKKAEEEKKEKEREKEENKRKREQKKKEREEKSKQADRKRKQKERGKQRRNKNTKRRKKQEEEHACCLECGLYSDESDYDLAEEQWIQCESCLEWTHQSCGGHPNASLNDLAALTYLCKTCEAEDITDQ